jgi:RND family efflux transporter MFP subunit
MTVEIEKMNARWMRGMLALVLAGGVAGCGNAQADAENTDAAEFVRVINVEVRDIEARPFVDRIRLTASVAANQDVQVSAEESGPIREILAEKGTSVSQGQPIAKIDDAILGAQVEQARAQAELAGQTWERRKRLYEEDQVGSEIAYLEAKFGAEQTAANLRTLEVRLARTTIRAPFDGVLDRRLVEVGTMVSPGQVVGRVVDLDPVKIQAGVPERYAADVHKGAVADVSFDVLPGTTHQARITYVGSTVDPQNRTFPIELVMPNPNGVIKPEMVANVGVARRDLESALVVPQDALVRVEDGYVVFVIADRGKGTVAEVRPVQLGPSQRNEVVVESGVEVGEQLIVVGQKSVADGDRVNVVGTR